MYVCKLAATYVCLMCRNGKRGWVRHTNLPPNSNFTGLQQVASFLNTENDHMEAMMLQQWVFYPSAAGKSSVVCKWKTVYWQLITHISDKKTVIYLCIFTQRQFFMHIMHWHVNVSSRIQCVSGTCYFLDGLQYVTDHLCVWTSHSCRGIKEEDNAQATKAQDVSVYCS